jgi:sortase (surface protein transpeptidase)
VAIIAVVATGLAGGGMLGVGTDAVGQADPPAPVPTATATVGATPTHPPPSPAEGLVTPAAPTRVEVPTVGLVVDVLPVTPDGGELDPPTLDEAYWIEPYGSPGTGSDNTVYLAGHSFDSGPAAFNPLFDKDSQVARVAPGDEVVVTTDSGRLTYEVEAAERYPKDELADVDEVWKVVPDRLVLITCFQRNGGGASQDNLVVYAHLVSSMPLDTGA